MFKSLLSQLMCGQQVLLFVFQFSRPTAQSAEGLLLMESVYVCLYPVPHFEACDWSTRFMRVISLGLSSVNRFYSTDWDTAKEVMVAYRSVHNCTSSFVSVHNTTVQSC